MGQIIEFMRPFTVQRSRELMDKIDMVEVMVEMMGYEMGYDDHMIHFRKDGKCPFSFNACSDWAEVKVYALQYKKKLDQTEIKYITWQKALDIIEKLL